MAKKASKKDLGLGLVGGDLPTGQAGTNQEANNINSTEAKEVVAPQPPKQGTAAPPEQEAPANSPAAPGEPQAHAGTDEIAAKAAELQDTQKPNDPSLGSDDLDEGLQAMKERYAKNYPGAKYLLVSSDNQVFLNSNEGDAKAHQRTMDAKRELQRIDL